MPRMPGSAVILAPDAVRSQPRVAVRGRSEVPMGRNSLSSVVRCFSFVACLAALSSCSGAPQRHSTALTPRTGMLAVPDGKVWYQIAGTGTGTPLLVLHGGPGISSHYLKPLAGLGADRPVVFYDQLGAGRSERPADSTLWNIDHFVREVAEVRKALGLDEVHIYGHSWGSVLAVEYM